MSPHSQIPNALLPTKSRYVPIVQAFLREAMSRKTLSPSWLKRCANALIPTSHLPQAVSPLSKPNGNSAMELFWANPIIFGSGTQRLPPDDHPLKVSRIIELHQTHCAMCMPSISEQCHISSLVRCLEYGWLPPINRSYIKPAYKVSGNYPSISQYHSSVANELTEMENQGVL